MYKLFSQLFLTIIFVSTLYTLYINCITQISNNNCIIISTIKTEIMKNIIIIIIVILGYISSTYTLTFKKILEEV